MFQMQRKHACLSCIAMDYGSEEVTARRDDVQRRGDAVLTRQSGRYGIEANGVPGVWKGLKYGTSLWGNSMSWMQNIFSKGRIARNTT
ncbi:hypothetical protein NECAME_11224 [Necator americanus]|uniref:Uncharacterized protein n=1 Tax=Necator americanus TaxID=51031 RepID=W2T6F6_NECAM|nr:hypothetical protein NECAME_11224 [Necator americanus]ETN77209.1 hypothetical protein NECAME_11224 [Necator americanus]